jgi:hypothetical protein
MSTARENHAYQGISLGIFRITYDMILGRPRPAYISDLSGARAFDGSRAD